MNSNQSIKGFTLIELMIVVAIIGIISVIAIPSYQNSVNKARRADATGALVSFAASMERRFTETNSYCNNGTTVATSASGDCFVSGNTVGDTGAPLYFSDQVPTDSNTNAYYDLTISAVTSSTFTLTATRTSGGAMDGDDCGDFTLNNVGRRALVNNDSSMAIADCW